MDTSPTKRLLSAGFPDMDKLAHDAFAGSVLSRPDDSARVERMVKYLARLVKMESDCRILVLGCGPYPEPIKILAEKGFSTTGVEPVDSFVDTAKEYLGSQAVVLQGAAEQIPVDDGTQDIVWFESVAEHVDSIRVSLEAVSYTHLTLPTIYSV